MKVNKQAKREARQLYLLCLVNGLLDEHRVRLTVQGALASKRRNAPAVLAHFLRLVRLDCTRHSITVESVVPLAPDLQSAIQSCLFRRYGPGLSASFSLSPSLIGGMRVRIGYDVYDGSVRAGLASLEKCLLNGGACV